MRMAKLNEIVDKWVKKSINFSQASWYGKHGEYIFLCAFKFCMAHAQSLFSHKTELNIETLILCGMKLQFFRL